MADANFTDEYLRRGRESGITDRSADNGYALPREIDSTLSRELHALSPLRRLSQVVQTGSSGYRKLVSAGGWQGDDGPPDFREIAPPSGELYANPTASQAMLDDAGFDVEGWLASEIAMDFARAETPAFVSGSGVNRPKGFLNAGLEETVGPVDADTLVSVIHALKAGYRQGATWVMNSATLAQVRKLKTADGASLWMPGLVEDQPDRLLGYPVVEIEGMPDLSPGETPIAFGNFRAGYLITERSATQILRDPFTNKPFVHFYATKRVGGQVLNANAIKVLRCPAQVDTHPKGGDSSEATAPLSSAVGNADAPEVTRP